MKIFVKRKLGKFERKKESCVEIVEANRNN